MSRFAHRSASTELIDQPDVPFEDWIQCLRELNTINRLLGGHRITVEGVRKLLPSAQREIVIAEIGCGGGDNLRAIHRWNRERYSIRYIGVDLNAACIQFAHEHCRELPSARFICSDYRTTDFGGARPDIIFSSLFCHHFSNEELAHMLPWMHQRAALGFFINDLQRHPLAYHSIRILTRLFSRSYLIRNDAPVSVTRGFTAGEWRALLRRANIVHGEIVWKWAFRHLVTVKND